eukprot:2290693-Rhodomonas_salina.2
MTVTAEQEVDHNQKVDFSIMTIQVTFQDPERARPERRYQLREGKGQVGTVPRSVSHERVMRKSTPSRRETEAA